jgi:hypothetical protein
LVDVERGRGRESIDGYMDGWILSAFILLTVGKLGAVMYIHDGNGDYISGTPF